jgi:hypothetical protein
MYDNDCHVSQMTFKPPVGKRGTRAERSPCLQLQATSQGTVAQVSGCLKAIQIRNRVASKVSSLQLPQRLVRSPQVGRGVPIFSMEPYRSCIAAFWIERFTGRLSLRLRINIFTSTSSDHWTPFSPIIGRLTLKLESIQWETAPTCTSSPFFRLADCRFRYESVL